MLSRFHLIPERHGRTDGRTDGQNAISIYIRRAIEIMRFDEILYTAADFELDERHVIKNEKVALDKLRVRQNIFIVLYLMSKLLLQG